jgi:cell division transport system permease protein
MNWVTTKRVLRAGFLDFWRNGFISFSSVMIMTVTLFILGMMLFVGIMLNTTLAQLRDKADVNVYFTANAAEEDILQLQKSIQALPEVESAAYVSAEDALVAFRARHQNDQLILQSLNELGQNPLRAVLNIKAKDISQYASIANFLKQQQALSTGSQGIIDKVNYFDAQHRQALDRLEKITNAAGQLGFVIIAIFVVTTIMTLFNMIRLAIFTSREEIQVMRLVGAGQFYIRAPFMVEGLIQGFVAGSITLIIFYPVTYWLGSATEEFFGGINIFSYYLSHFPIFFLIIIGSGALIGAVANFLAVRRYLKI